MKIGTFFRTALLLLSFMSVLSISASADVQLKHSYPFADGTANDAIGGADGVIMGTTGTVTGGAYVSGSDSYISIPGDSLNLGSYSAITLEAYFTTAAGANGGSNVMLAYFGDVSGKNDLWIQPVKKAGGSQISAGDLYPAGVALNDGDSYCVTVVLTADTLFYYIDGTLSAKAATGADLISVISNANAWIGKGGWSDPLWNGTLFELNIYEGAMTDSLAMIHANLKPNSVLKHSYTFEDGTANDVVGTAHGVLTGGVVSNGSYTASANGQFVTLPAADIAINTYNDITIEAFITSDVDNTGNNMLAYLGGAVGNLGGNGYFLTPDRVNESRTGISCGNTTQPWTVEQGVTGAAVSVGAKHHVVSVLTTDSMFWYIDGALSGTASISDYNAIANLSNDNAWLCKGGYTNDPTWLGSINEFNIYEGVFSAGDAAGRYQSYLAVKSSDNNLASLAIDGALFDAAFDAATTTYNVQVPDGTASVNVAANVKNPLASLTGDGDVVLTAGSAVATIEVTAEDGSVKTYTVNITADANFTPAFVVTGTVSDYLNSASAFSVPEYASMYWTGDQAAVLSQSPAVDSVITGSGNHTIVLMAELNGKVETKFLTVNLISASYWIGAESSDFHTIANWGGIQSLGAWTAVHVGPVAEGNFDCIFSKKENNQHQYTVFDGGKLFIDYNGMNIDRLYMNEGGELTVRSTGSASVRNDFTLNGGTINIIDEGKIDQKAGKKFYFAKDTLTEATLNIFGGTSWFTDKVIFGKGTAHINMKGGGVANFASEAVIVNADTTGILKPVEGSLLVHVAGATTVSSIDLPLPATRTEALDANAQLVLPDYFMLYSSGDSAANSTIVYTQTPVAGTVYTADMEVVSVVVEATDFFGNVIKDTIAVTVRTNSNVWRGDFSENYADSANWEMWPIIEWSEIFIDKTFASSFDPIFTSGVQWGELVLAPGNTLYIKGGDCKPNDPIVMDKTSSIVIDGGVLNIRESGASAIDNGTITVLSHKEGYAWSDFDHKAAFTFATNADDEFTFNAWGGKAWLGNTSVGAGKVSITLKDDGIANFNDSTMVATLLASKAISAVEGYHLFVNANYTELRADTLVSIDMQVGLVDDNDDYTIPDFTGLAVYAATNPITVTQSPLKDVVINGVGMYTVTLTATDEWGNASTTDFDLELINYVVDCPAISTLTDDNPTDSVIIPDYAAMATTRGLWKENVVISQFPLAGDTVALDSIFEVTLTAVDDASQTNFCKFTVTVVDTTVPVITDLADQILTLDGFCTVKIPDYGAMVEVTDICHKDFVITQTPVAGTQLIGVGDAAIVNVLVADGNGNVSDTLIFTATAADLTNPVVTKAFGDHGLRANADCEAVLRDYAALVTAEDNCASALLITQTPDAGTVLSGDGDSVVVTVTIDDQNGNKIDTAWVVKLAAAGCSVDSNSDKNIVLVTNDDRDSEQQTWLVAQGFNVTTYYSTALGAAPQEEIDALNAADLVILGRSVASNDFGSASATDKVAWNALTVPVIANSQWIVRNTKLNWFNSGTATHDNTATEALMALVSMPADDVFEFANVAAADSLVDWFTPPFDYLDNASAATNGTVLVSHSTYPLYVRFAANTEFYPTAVDMPAADRTYFGFGNDNVGGVAYFFPLTNNAKAAYYAEIRTMLGMSVEAPTIVDGVVDADAKVASLSIYPSPASSSITIDASGLGEDVVVSIVDMQGKVVAVYTDITSTVSVDGLSAGVYMVKAVSVSSSAVSKFVKE